MKEIDLVEALDEQANSTARIVCYSCKDFGYQLLRSWIDQIHNKNIPNLSFIEIVHIEFAFLSMAKGVFASNLKQKLKSSEHTKTMLVFGSLTEIAEKMHIPNKYTGYIFLLDKNNRVRWRASGLPIEGELDCLYKCIDELKNETNKRRI